jgi:hypothetical protein
LRCAEFFSRPRQIDVFAMKFAVAIMKGVHADSVTAVFGSARVRNVAPKARYHSSLGQRPRSSVNSNRALKARSFRRVNIAAETASDALALQQ